MLEGNYVLFALLLVSTLLVVFFGILIMRIKNKQQLHYAFLSVIATMAYWSLIRLIQFGIYLNSGRYYVFLEYMHYIGVCLLPITVLLTGLIFAKTQIELNYKYLLLLAVPAVTLTIVFTNSYHQLFIVEYSFISTDFVYGPYYIFHEIYSYGCILIGLFYLLYFSIKNSGFFSKQSLLICAGVVVPLAVVVLSTQQVVNMPVFVENISFSFAIVCFSIAIFKFRFLDIMPIALQKIVDLISDSYVVVNQEMEVVDYNKAFVDTFQEVMDIRRGETLANLLIDRSKVKIDLDRILAGNKLAIQNKTSERFEMHVQGEQFDRYFEIELTPIYSGDTCIGSIILFKDVSVYKRNIEIIKRDQEIILEKERMASLGQMIGGIAHNLRTPIMSLAGGIEALRDLAEEYRDSLDDKSVTVEDHREIAGEMLGWLDKMKPYCTYMSDIISAVKGQAVQLNSGDDTGFIIDELVRRIELLMKHDLNVHHCTLVTKYDIDLNTEIRGELNTLVQIFTNIIINAIQAYEDSGGEIIFSITKNNEDIEFALSDRGKGIPGQVQNRLFKEMITTKGKDGTGLGLYMSYSAIKGRFGGNMWFESKEGEGTTFYITIPLQNEIHTEV